MTTVPPVLVDVPVTGEAEFISSNPHRRKHPQSAVMGKIVCYDSAGSKVGHWGGTVCFLSHERGKGPCLVVRRSCDTKAGRGSYYNLGHLKKVMGSHVASGNLTLFFNATPTAMKKDCSLLITADKAEPIDFKNLAMLYSVAASPRRWSELEKNLSMFGVRGRQAAKGLDLSNPGEGNTFVPREPGNFEDEEGDAGGRGEDDDFSLGDAEEERDVLDEALAHVESQGRWKSGGNPKASAVSGLIDDEDDQQQPQQPQHQEGLTSAPAEEEEEFEIQWASKEDEINAAVYDRFKQLVEAQGGHLSTNEDGYVVVEGCSGEAPDFEVIQAQVHEEFAKKAAAEGDQQDAAQPAQEQAAPATTVADLAGTMSQFGDGETLDLDAFKQQLLQMKTQPELSSELPQAAPATTEESNEQDWAEAEAEAEMLQQQLLGGAAPLGNNDALTDSTNVNMERGKRNRGLELIDDE